MRAVAKTQDNGATGDGKPMFEQAAEDLSKMSQTDRTLALIKLAQSRPL